jgi:hypothetical protein
MIASISGLMLEAAFIKGHLLLSSSSPLVPLLHEQPVLPRLNAATNSVQAWSLTSCTYLKKNVSLFCRILMIETGGDNFEHIGSSEQRAPMGIKTCNLL